MDTYTFTQDWTTGQLSEWRKHVFPVLNGTGQPVDVLEIGSYEGRSAVAWIENIPKLRKLVCVDPWQWNGGDEAHVRFHRNTSLAVTQRGFPTPMVNAVRVPSDIALDGMRGKGYAFDLAYIDGDHSGRAIITDFVNVLWLVKPGALILFDDYLWKPHEKPDDTPPKIAIDAILACWKDRLEVLHKGYQVLVRWNGEE